MTSLLMTRARFVIEPRQVPRGATLPYLLHQAVADLYGQFADRPYLYRADDEVDGGSILLILSTRHPEPPWEGSRHGVAVDHLATKSFELDVPAHSVLDFEIKLNATKDAAPVPDSKRSRRMDVWEAVWREDRATSRTQRDVYGDYLRRKLEGAADVRSCWVTSRGLVRARRPARRAAAITHVATNVIGSLEVLDCEHLRSVMARGIGRSRAFGCGLLCLSRPGTVLPRRHTRVIRELYA